MEGVTEKIALTCMYVVTDSILNRPLTEKRVKAKSQLTTATYGYLIRVCLLDSLLLYFYYILLQDNYKKE